MILNRLVLAAATLFVLGPSFAAKAPEPAAAKTAIALVPDITLLESMEKARAKLFNAGHINGVALRYDEDAVLLPPGAPAVIGRDAIRAFFARQAATAKAAGLTLTPGADSALGISGDMGWQSGTYAMKDPRGNVAETGTFLSISRKVGGKWFYVRYAWNPDRPPAASAAPAPSEPHQ